MKRIKLVVAYDGTNYCGWQLQKNGVTIEGLLNQALSGLLKETVTVTGASRTDSGVHGEGNVAVFDTENPMASDKICYAVNQRLPEDVRVLSSEEVPSGFHPRKCNCIKTYEYRILNRKIDRPTERLYSYFCYYDLDVEKMRRGAAYLVGEHDFKSFCAAGGKADDTVRTIYSLDVEKNGDKITIRVSGSGFLYNMVRIIAGTLIRVGTGACLPENVEDILEARDRSMAGPTAPAKGLTLMSLEYEKELEPVISRENRHWKYRLIQSETLLKGCSYLLIDRCEEQYLQDLAARVVRQAFWNGAKRVLICDKAESGQPVGSAEKRLGMQKRCGHFDLEHVYDFYEMEMTLPAAGQEEYRSDPSSCAESGRSCPMITVKEVENQDIEAFVERLNQEFFTVQNSATLSVSQMKKEAELGKYQCYFIILDGMEAGAVMVSVKADGSVMLESLCTRADLRGKGIGTAAIRWMKSWFSGREADRLVLWVCSANNPALSLYLRCGFQKKKVIDSWYEAKNLDYIGKRG